MHWTRLKPASRLTPKSCSPLWRLLAFGSPDTMPGNGTARARRLSSEGDSGQLPLSVSGLRNSILTGGGRLFSVEVWTRDNSPFTWASTGSAGPMRSRAQATFLVELAGSLTVPDLSSSVAGRAAGANRTRLSAGSSLTLRKLSMAADHSQMPTASVLPPNIHGRIVPGLGGRHLVMAVDGESSPGQSGGAVDQAWPDILVQRPGINAGVPSQRKVDHIERSLTCDAVCPG